MNEKLQLAAGRRVLSGHWIGLHRPTAARAHAHSGRFGATTSAELRCRRCSLPPSADVELLVDHGGGDRRKQRLADYVSSFPELRATAAATGRPVPYARTWNYEDDCESLCADVEPPLPHFEDYFMLLQKGQQPPFHWLFLGPAGAVTPLHVDVWHTDAWLCNFQGRKRFLLFHPGQRRHLEDDAGFVDLLNPDEARFPKERLARATPVEVVLGPGAPLCPSRRLPRSPSRLPRSSAHRVALLPAGETIYIPRLWPHYVESLEDTVSLTVNFLPKCNRTRVLEKVVAYARRRSVCEALLRRPLRASDNVLKFCVHGGEAGVPIPRCPLARRLSPNPAAVCCRSTSSSQHLSWA